jgi:branched-chain amino acid transport system substrate-binding protein
MSIRGKHLGECAAVLAAIMLVLVSCGGNSGSQSSGGGTSNVIKFGVIAPLTGSGATYGEPQAYAIKALAKQVNDAGGVKIGDKTYTIEVVLDDPKGDPAATKQIINKQIFQDHINFSITNGDPIDPIAAPVTEQNKIIMLDNTANKAFYSPPYKYILDGYATPDWASKPFFQTLTQLQPNVKSIYFVGIDAAFDHNHLQWEEEAATGLGLKSLGKAFYQASVDFASFLTPVVAAKPDMVSIGVPSGDTPTIVKTLRQLGFKGVVGTPIPLSDMTQMIEGVGAAMDGYIQADDVSYPLTQDYKDFETLYKSFGVHASTTAAGYYIFDAVFLDALKRAGTISDPDKIIQAMKSATYTDKFIAGSPMAYMSGSIRYGQTSQLVLPLTINQVQGGALVTKVTEQSPGDLK